MTAILPFLWAIFTVFASLGQIMRNILQRDLTITLGTIGATHVRFLFGLPFGLCFLSLALVITGTQLPSTNLHFWAWTAMGGASQIAATALMLATMKSRSFVVTTAYIKTEPLQLVLFGFIALGDRLTWGNCAAILIATTGVMLISWPQKSDQNFNWKPAFLGLLAGGLFALSAIGFRGGIRSLESENFVIAASFTLAIGLVMQAFCLSLYLLLKDKNVLIAIFKSWRQSLRAGFIGALTSQLWFLAFALETAAKVRTLALIEILFAQLVSGKLFKEKTNKRERMGLIMVALGCGLILSLAN